MHEGKTRLYRAESVKVVTGVALSGSEIRVQNKQRKNIYQDLVQWLISKEKIRLDSLNNRLLGRLNAQGQVDFRFRDKARTLRREIS